jgi:uncharacterized membrane protein
LNKTIKISLFILLLIWCFGYMIEFFIPVSNKLVYLIPFLKNNYSLVCHQDSHKLIRIGVYSMLVCARCAGIYSGAFLVSFISIFVVKPIIIPAKILFLSAVPMLFDVIATTAGIYYYSKTAAFLTGILFGVVSFLYFYNALLELIIEIREKNQ